MAASGWAQQALLASPEWLHRVRLAGPDGQQDRRRRKKLAEVAGFCEHVVRVVEEAYAGTPVTFLECSCGKSYLVFALQFLLRQRGRTEDRFVGIDVNERLIETCRETAESLDLPNMRFEACRSRDFDPGEPVDVLLALHACDSATDEAIAVGVRLNAKYVMVVPCCQNQIRGQIKSGHPLMTLTEFGPLRYVFANVLTEALRALYLRGRGYDVSITEVVPPTITPKNLMISARRMKRPRRNAMKGFEELRDYFDVKPHIEKLCNKPEEVTNG